MSDHHNEILQLQQELTAARREKEEVMARVKAERCKNQRTTLEEYLYNCHFYLHTRFELTDISKSSTGFTKIDGKYYPRWLRPWTSFSNTQRQHQLEAIRTVCGKRRLFFQESTTRDLGTTIEHRRAGNENAVDDFEKAAVEDPVRDILRPAWDEEELRKEYRCMGLQFGNNIRHLTQPSDEREERRRPDGAGIRKGLDGDESVAFVYDYEAAHKVALK